jgi:hypothetical protein
MLASSAILPVIHVADREQVLRNLEIVRLCKADGFFLINHGFSSDSLAELISELQSEGALEDLWTGANFLGLDNQEAIAHAGSLGLDGLWTDNAKVGCKDGWEEIVLAERQEKESLAPDTLYFGGTAFKYQPSLLPTEREASAVGDCVDVINIGGVDFKYQPSLLPTESEARSAVDYVDVITTVGSVTQDSSIAKLQAIRAAIGDHPLAIARGTTASNIQLQLPYADAILPASGVKRSWYEIDSSRLSELITLRDQWLVGNPGSHNQLRRLDDNPQYS